MTGFGFFIYTAPSVTGFFERGEKMTRIGHNYLSNLRLLKTKASRHAVIGVLISGVALVAAVLLSSYFLFGEISLEGIVHVQKNNMLLWFMEEIGTNFDKKFYCNKLSR